MMSDNSISEVIMVESNEGVVASVSTTLRMPMMRGSCESTDSEDLRIKIVESDIVSDALHECRPRVESPANPWAKL